MKTGEDNEQQLNEEGYLDLEALGYLPAPTVLEHLRLRLRKVVGSINKLQKLHTSRKATNLPLSKMGKAWFQTVFASTELVDIIHTYLIKGALIHGVQEINCPAGTPSQHLHRDHGFGAQCALVLAISLDGKALKTELQPGSHLDHIAPCTQRGALERDRIERAKHLKAMQGQMMLYDPHIMHCGGANLTEEELSNRVFIMMVSKDMHKGDVQEINETNATVGYKSELLSSVLAKKSIAKRKGGTKRKYEGPFNYRTESRKKITSTGINASFKNGIINGFKI